MLTDLPTKGLIFCEAAEYTKIMKNTLFMLIGLLGLGAITVLIVLYANDHSASSAAACSGQYVTHTVEITDGKPSPDHVDGQYCEHLTIINNDNILRLIAFGQHDKHTLYDGVSEAYLRKGQSLSVQLVQKGTFTFHDHLHDEVSVDFSVR